MFFSNYANRGRTGLVNLGNTCYMNSGLQCLSSILSLTDFVLKCQKYSSFEKLHGEKQEYPLVKAYIDLITAIWEEECKIQPKTFKRVFGAISRQFLGYQQQDTQEFLQFLLDNLHEGMAVPNQSKKEQSVSVKAWNAQLANKKSIVSDLFYGQLHGETKCPECNFVSCVYDNFSILTVPIPLNQSNLNLHHTLASFVAGESLDSDNKWNCDKCKKDVEAQRKLTLHKLPKVLIICLKRFSKKFLTINDPKTGRPVQAVQNQKIVVNVDCPMTLDITPYTDDNKKRVYTLQAVANHTGGLSGGHYYAYTKNANGKWYEFNDASVSEIVNVITPNAYVLFFVEK